MCMMNYEKRSTMCPNKGFLAFQAQVPLHITKENNDTHT